MYFCVLKLILQTMNSSFAIRLKAARNQAKLSMRELADKAGNVVTFNSIKKYEDGLMVPEPATMLALANALGVKIDYFMRPMKVELGNVDFRKKSSMKVKDIVAIKEQIRDFLERYLEVEEILGMNHRFDKPQPQPTAYLPEQVENAVNLLQNQWGIIGNPIANVVEFLESLNFKVLLIDAPTTFHGLSTWVGQIPVIVINQNDSVERRRFTALHELGHLVLDFGDLIERDIEKRCHQFAGAMLLPERSMKAELGNYRTSISFGELVALKEKYGISVQATMFRARQLDIIHDYTYKQFCMSIARNRREENLGAYKGEEKSYRFDNLLFRLVSEDLVSINKAANLGNMKVAEFRDKLDALPQ